MGRKGGPPTGGRVTILTPEFTEKFCKLLPAVQYLKTAADCMGVSGQSIRNWLNRGRKEAARLNTPGNEPIQSEAVYLAFFCAHKKALAEGAREDCELIVKAARDGQRQASAWRLERR